MTTLEEVGRIAPLVAFCGKYDGGVRLAPLLRKSGVDRHYIVTVLPRARPAGSVDRDCPARAGEIPSFRLGSNVLRFSAADVEAWLEAKRHDASTR